MTPDQKGVATFAPLALLVTLSAFGLVYFEMINVTSDAVTASFLAVLPLVYCVGTIGNKRFFHTDAIEGGGYDTANNSVTIDKAIALNTLEQVVIAVVTYHALERVLPDLAPTLLAVLPILFLVGRIFFIAGYRHGARSRAFGFGLTFYPNALIAIALLAVLATSSL